MGIFPYQTPEELISFDKRIQHYKDFLKSKGYKDCYDIYENRTWNNIFKAKKEYKAPNGKVYKGVEKFYQGYGCYPLLEKDNIYYGYYDPRTIENYVDPFQDEIEFLENKGFVRCEPFSKDYIENNTLEEEFFNKNGFVPRWTKYGAVFSQEMALTISGYKYNEWK